MCSELSSNLDLSKLVLHSRSLVNRILSRMLTPLSFSTVGTVSTSELKRTEKKYFLVTAKASSENFVKDYKAGFTTAQMLHSL